MFEKKYYTRKQRKLYGLGWFAISFILVIVFITLDWTVLGYIASAFAIMSLYTGFFTKTEDFDNPKDYADNINRLLKNMKNSLLKIKKNKKDILSYVETLEPIYNNLFGNPKKGNDISFQIKPELEPFQVQVFFHELPEFSIDIYSVKKYEGFLAGIESNEKKIKVNIESDSFPEKPNNLTKKLNKILLKYPNVVDDALIEKPWKSK